MTTESDAADAAAVSKGRLSLDFAHTIVADGVGLSGMTVAEASSALGINAALLRAVSLATGIPLPRRIRTSGKTILSS